MVLRDMENQSDNLSKLRTVFDVCDENKEGHITVDHFKNLVREHFGGADAEELSGIIQILNPEGKQKINFDDFCQGVQKILRLHKKDFLEINPKRKWLDGLEDDTINTEHQETSETSNTTYSEYDINTDEDAVALNTDLISLDRSVLGDVCLQLPITSEDDRDSAISGKSSEINENSRHEITDEDNYEDFGEAEELESQSEADSPSYSRGHINCDKCKKARHRKDFLSRHHRRSCPNRRVTSAAYASQLHRNATASPVRRNSFGSDEIFDDIDGNFQELNDKLKHLEKQVSLLTENQFKNEDKHVRLKDENSSLIKKVHNLEEQLREMEIRSEERVKDERSKHQDYVSRQERDKSDQLHYLTQRLQCVEKDYEEVKEVVPQLRFEVEKLKQEKMELHDKLSETQYSYATLAEEHEKQEEEMMTQVDNFEHERKGTAQLLDELGKELGELRRYKIDTEHLRLKAKSISELPDKCRELEMELHILREKNRNLQTSNEDLNDQILSRCMEEGRRLLKYRGAVSLADEIDDLTKEELMAGLKDQQEVNARLRQYVDKIILRILENNPSILEIKH